jgi:hypothetical protein
MRVLVACETSGAVRNAFRALGHDAWSCDLLPSDDFSMYHFQKDVREVMAWPKVREHWQTKAEPFMWDLMVAHPPCTHLAVSGAAWFEEKRADGRQKEAIDFFIALAKAPIPRIAIENPVCIMSTVWREPDQIIHPWSFGHPEQKTTCLWLKGLPPLIGTKNVYAEMMELPKKDRERIHYMSPGPDRWKERSKTFQGVADAMAAQWGDYSDLVTQMETNV